MYGRYYSRPTLFGPNGGRGVYSNQSCGAEGYLLSKTGAGDPCKSPMNLARRRMIRRGPIRTGDARTKIPSQQYKHFCRLSAVQTFLSTPLFGALSRKRREIS